MNYNDLHCSETPSVDWQRQMAIANTFAYNQYNNNKRSYPPWIHETPRTYDQKFRPLKQLNLPHIFFNDEPQEQQATYNGEEEDDFNIDSNLSTKLINARSDLWDANQMSPLQTFILTFSNIRTTAKGTLN